MNKLLRTTTAATIGLAVFSYSAFASSFTDVKEGDLHFLAISSLQEQGIIEGYSDGTFKPKSKINRAEGLQMIAKTVNMTSVEELNNTAELVFNDVATDNWYAKIVEIAYKKGFISGYPDNTFRPGNTINLVEALKIILELAITETADFEILTDYLHKDTPLDAWFTKYATYAASLGLLDIRIDNTIDPDQEMTRGYLAEILYRLKKSGEGFEFGKATWYGYAVQGSNTASGKTFDADAFTAAHKFLPFGAMVEVTNLANGKSVQVEITDRGPYGPGRVLDLSSGAFKQIALLSSGIINAQYKVTYLP